MWYVIQTVTGKEEEVLLQMNSVLGRDHFQDCFIIRAEWLKKLGGRWQIQVRPLFPGYIFVETRQPERLFLKIRDMQGYAKLLETGRFEFTALEEEEEEFLKKICQVEKIGGDERGNKVKGENRNVIQNGTRNRNWLVRLSVAQEGKRGEGWRIEGPLKAFERQIERINLHKRYAVVRVTICRREQTVLFGLVGAGKWKKG